MQLYPNLKVDVMIAPHHGSLRTINIDFLRQLAPNIIICSCSQADSKKISATLPYKKAQWYFTGIDGAVTVQISPKAQITISRFIKKQPPHYDNTETAK
jgi:beta-lactamase superfamily II metal-dependent hydrolase